MGLVVSVPNVLHVQVKVCTDGSSSSPWEELGSFDKSIYNLFSKQDDMKTLQVPTRIKSEFDMFLEAAIAKTTGQPYNVSFDALDTHLGTIGVTNEVC